MLMMLIKPDYYLNSARKGLSLFATSVLPSLFPFYFFSLLLTYIGAAKSVSSLLGRPVKLLFNAPKESAYILFLSMLSGYPVGASMTSELYLAGAISQKEVKSISAFASTSGPIFMLGTVGSAVFNDVRIGAIILSAHYLAALLNGIVFRLRKSKNEAEAAQDFRVQTLATDQDAIMSRTIASSTMNMLYVGGYIVICSMLVDTISLLKIDSLILTGLGESAGMPIVAILSGLIEMTRGSIACSECGLHIGAALCAAIISFGGLSVTLQNYTFLSKCGMTLPQIFLRKGLHSVFAFVIAFALSFLL